MRPLARNRGAMSLAQMPLWAETPRAWGREEAEPGLGQQVPVGTH